MKFRYCSEYHPSPDEPNDYISEGLLDIVDWTDDGREHILGRLAIDCINVPRVLYEGRDHLYEVCDADSQGWQNVFAAILDYDTCELIPEVGCNEPFDFLFLIYRMQLHPVIKHLELFILYHAARINGESAICTVLEGVTSVGLHELGKIGFRKIASSELLFYPVMLKSNLPDISDAELDLRLDSAVDYTNELLACWNADVESDRPHDLGGLVLHHEGTELSYFLEGKRISTNDIVEILRNGVWHRARFEWSEEDPTPMAWFDDDNGIELRSDTPIRFPC